jgi:hypothetical protein
MSSRRDRGLYFQQASLSFLCGGEMSTDLNHFSTFDSHSKDSLNKLGTMSLRRCGLGIAEFKRSNLGLKLGLEGSRQLQTCDLLLKTFVGWCGHSYMELNIKKTKDMAIGAH